MVALNWSYTSPTLIYRSTKTVLTGFSSRDAVFIQSIESRLDNQKSNKQNEQHSGPNSHRLTPYPCHSHRLYICVKKQDNIIRILCTPPKNAAVAVTAIEELGELEYTRQNQPHGI